MTNKERILKTLELVKNIRGNIKIALSRELTKLFEETVVDNISNVLDYYKDGIKGEIVCMLYAQDNFQQFDIQNKINILKKNKFSTKDIAKILYTLYKLNKNDVYELTMKG